MPESQLGRRADGRRAPLSQPQWQNLFVAPALPEGFAEDVEQEWAEEQPSPVQQRPRSGRGISGGAA